MVGVNPSARENWGLKARDCTIAAMTNPLRYQTPPAWTEAVLDDFDSFLLDHAATEKAPCAGY